MTTNFSGFQSIIQIEFVLSADQLSLFLVSYFILFSVVRAIILDDFTSGEAIL
jgi:hypothetical protein